MIYQILKIHLALMNMKSSSCLAIKLLKTKIRPMILILQTKYKNVLNELNLQKESTRSNIKDLNNKIQQLELTTQVPTDKIQEQKKLVGQRD